MDERAGESARALTPAEKPGGRWLLPVLGLCGFSSTFAMRLVDPLVPTLSGEFGLPVATIATLVTAYGLSYALGQPLIGALGDAFGKVRTIMVAGTCLGLALVVSAFAYGFDMLFVLRCLTGLAGGGLIPVAMAAVADRVPVQERPVALARFIIFVTMGQMAGATGAGLIADVLGWRSPFILAAIVAFAGALAVALILKPRPVSERPPFSIGLAVENYRVVFRNPLARPLIGVAMIEGGLFFGATPFVAALLAERSGVGASEAGLVLAFSGLGAMAYGATSPLIVARFSSKSLPLMGGTIASAAFALFAMPWPWWSAFPLFFLMGFGFMLMHNMLQVRATELAPEARSSAVAVFAASLFLGQAIGPLVMAALPHSAAEPWGLLVFAAAVLALGLVVRKLIARG